MNNNPYLNLLPPSNIGTKRSPARRITSPKTTKTRNRNNYSKPTKNDKNSNQINNPNHSNESLKNNEAHLSNTGKNNSELNTQNTNLVSEQHDDQDEYDLISIWTDKIMVDKVDIRNPKVSSQIEPEIIPELIKNLESIRNTDANKGNIDNSRRANAAIIILKSLQKEKLGSEALNIHTKNIQERLSKARQDLKNLQERITVLDANMMNEFQTQRRQLKEKHKKEFKDFQKEWLGEDDNDNTTSRGTSSFSQLNNDETPIRRDVYNVIYHPPLDTSSKPQEDDDDNANSITNEEKSDIAGTKKSNNNIKSNKKAKKSYTGLITEDINHCINDFPHENIAVNSDDDDNSIINNSDDTKDSNGANNENSSNNTDDIYDVNNNDDQINEYSGSILDSEGDTKSNSDDDSILQDDGDISMSDDQGSNGSQNISDSNNINDSDSILDSDNIDDDNESNKANDKSDETPETNGDDSHHSSKHNTETGNDADITDKKDDDVSNSNDDKYKNESDKKDEDESDKEKEGLATNLIKDGLKSFFGDNNDNKSDQGSNDDGKDENKDNSDNDNDNSKDDENNGDDDSHSNADKNKIENDNKDEDESDKKDEDGSDKEKDGIATNLIKDGLKPFFGDNDDNKSLNDDNSVLNEDDDLNENHKFKPQPDGAKYMLFICDSEYENEENDENVEEEEEINDDQDNQSQGTAPIDSRSISSQSTQKKPTLDEIPPLNIKKKPARRRKRVRKTSKNQSELENQSQEQADSQMQTTNELDNQSQNQNQKKTAKKNQKKKTPQNQQQQLDQTQFQDDYQYKFMMPTEMDKEYQIPEQIPSQTNSEIYGQKVTPRRDTTSSDIVNAPITHYVNMSQFNKRVDYKSTSYRKERRLRHYNKTSAQLRELRRQIAFLYSENKIDKALKMEAMADEIEQNEIISQSIQMRQDYEKNVDSLMKKHREEERNLKKTQNAKLLAYEKAKQEDLTILERRIEKLENELKNASTKQRSFALTQKSSTLQKKNNRFELSGETKSVNNRDLNEDINESVTTENQQLLDDKYSQNNSMYSGEGKFTGDMAENQLNMKHSLNRNARRTQDNGNANRAYPLNRRRAGPVNSSYPITARRQIVKQAEFTTLKLPPLNATKQANKVIKDAQRSSRFNINYL